MRNNNTYHNKPKQNQQMMKKILSTIMLLVGAWLPTAQAAEALPLIQNVNAYESMLLNGAWNYIVDVQEEGYYDYRMNPTRWGFFQNAKPKLSLIHI